MSGSISPSPRKPSRARVTGIPPRTIVTSEINTVPVGFVMSVTPQINQNGNVSLNVRPTLTRILGFVTDPAPRPGGSTV